MKTLDMLPASCLELLRTSGAIRLLSAGELIFREGDPAYGMFLIMSGSVEIFRKGPSGDVVLNTLGENELFGEMGLILPPKARTAAARAKDKTVVLEVTRDLLDPDVTPKIKPEDTVKLLESVIRILVSRLHGKDDADSPRAPRRHQLNTGGNQVAGIEEDPEGVLKAIRHHIPEGLVSKWFNTKKLKPGEVLFKEGDHADSFYYLHEGSLEIYKEANPGERLAILNAPALVGEAGYFARRGRSATARAGTDARLTRLLKGDFDNHAKANPEEAAHILHAVAQWIILVILERETR
ncbi:MAG: cyclic nucleotide-binding domain-containing protein [Candidatus Sumerlaeia bacterium]|nr:cyclic nucleotide-binding domain-containing protein [Candidatus Sumerlaeia bacterium]